MYRTITRIATTALLVLAAAWANAQAGDWGNIAVISSTLGNNANRLCIGEGLRVTDIGCPTYAPYVSSNGNVGIGTSNPNAKLDVYGTVSATNFVGDGSGLTGVVAGTSDRIVSGTNNATSMIAVSSTGYISISQAGANSGWFDPYRGLVTLGVSATGPISGTSGYFGAPVGIAALPNSAYALNVSGTLNLQNSTGWAPLRGSQFQGIMTSGAYYFGRTFDSANSGVLYYDIPTGFFQIANNNSISDRGVLVNDPLLVSGTFTVSTSNQVATQPSVYVASNGFVGLGTNSPEAVLHVVSNTLAGTSVMASATVISGNADQRYGLIVRNTHSNPGAGNPFAGFAADVRDHVNGGYIRALFGQRHWKSDGGYGETVISSPYHMVFYVNRGQNVDSALSYGTAAMAITSGSLVGIGTTNPTAKLDVIGSISASNVYVTGTTGTVSATFAYFRFISGTQIYGSFVGDGSGLSGVTAGSSDRIVSGSTGGTRMVAISDTGYISITQAGANAGWFDPYRGLVTLGVSATGPISGTAGYFSGNVGIGTLSPRAKLEVSGGYGAPSTGSSPNGQFILADSGTSLMTTFGLNNPGTPYAWIQPRHATVAAFYNLALNPNGGNVGIGTTSPTATLQVSGSLVVSSTLTNNSPSLYVATDGRIGIGTGTPQRNVHIHGPGSSSTLVLTHASGGYGNYALSLYANNSAADGWGLCAGDFLTNGCSGLRRVLRGGSTSEGTVLGNYYGLTFWRDNEVVAARIDTLGRFGINTVYPSATLHVIGQTRISSWTTIANNVTPSVALDVYGIVSATNFVGDGSGLTNLSVSGDRISSGSTSIIATQDRSLTIASAGIQRAVVGENGNIGISTSTPNAKLHIVGANGDQLRIDNGGQQFSSVNFYSNGNFKGYARHDSGNGKMQFGSAVAEHLDLVTNDTPRLRVTSAGDVGIGTMSPNAALNVSGSFVVSTSAQTSMNPSFYVSGTTGNIGIRTNNPVYPLDVYGNVMLRNYLYFGGSGLHSIVGASTGIDIGFTYWDGAQSNPWLMMKDGGKIGIATTTPSATLHVSGTLRLAGTGAEACDANMTGGMRKNPTSGLMELCQ